MFSAFLRPLSDEFGWTRAETAGAFSLYLLAAGLSLPFWGCLADLRGVRLVFLLSALIDGSALLLLATLEGLGTFYLLYFLLGVGLGGIGPATVGKAVSEWFVAKRGRATGLALLGSSCGGLLLVPIAGYLIAALGWRAAFVGLGALALGGILPLVAFLLRDRPAELGLEPLGASEMPPVLVDVPEGFASAPREWTLREALSTPTFWLLGVTFSFGLGAAFGVTTHQVAFLQDRGLTLEAASTVAGIVLGMNMAGRFFVGWASESPQRVHQVLGLCCAVQAGGVGLAALESLALSLAVGCFFAFGLGFGGLMVLWPLSVAHDFGVRASGSIAGILGTVAVGFGGAAGPVIVGHLYDTTGSYFVAFLACSGAFAIAALAAMVTHEPRAT